MRENPLAFRPEGSQSHTWERSSHPLRINKIVSTSDIYSQDVAHLIYPRPMGCFSIGFLGFSFFFLSIWLFDSVLTGAIILAVLIGLFVIYSTVSSFRQLDQAKRYLDIDVSEELTDELVAKFDNTAVLFGTERTQVRVVGLSEHLDNLQTVLVKAQSEVPEKLELASDLVATKEDGKEVVAVTLGGLRLGSVADMESQDIFKEVFELGGLARADCLLFREDPVENSRLYLLIAKPIKTLNKYQIALIKSGRKVKGISN